eukprot:3771826-Pyramimonas_sp.AAC.1
MPRPTNPRGRGCARACAAPAASARTAAPVRVVRGGGARDRVPRTAVRGARRRVTRPASPMHRRRIGRARGRH